VVLTDPAAEDSPILYADHRFLTLTGYDEAEVVGRNCRFLGGEATAEEPVAAIREAVAAGEPATVELRNYRKDGTAFWNRVSIAPIRDADGGVVNYVGFQGDVTERTERERELREERAFTEQALDAPDDVFYVFDVNGEPLR
jgi:PAS domain S-box-containing protein